MKFSLPINMKMPTIVGIFIFISTENCSAMFSKKEFAIVSNLRFIRKTNFMLSWVEHEKKFYNLGASVCLRTFGYPHSVHAKYTCIWSDCADAQADPSLCWINAEGNVDVSRLNCNMLFLNNSKRFIFLFYFFFILFLLIAIKGYNIDCMLFLLIAIKGIGYNIDCMLSG